MNAALTSIRDAKTILLTTYKRDGTPVATPARVAARALARQAPRPASHTGTHGAPPDALPHLALRARSPVIQAGGYPTRGGGPWLWRTLVLSLFHAVVVPSGFRTTVQPHSITPSWPNVCSPDALITTAEPWKP